MFACVRVCVCARACVRGLSFVVELFTVSCSQRAGKVRACVREETWRPPVRLRVQGVGFGLSERRGGRQ